MGFSYSACLRAQGAGDVARSPPRLDPGYQKMGQFHTQARVSWKAHGRSGAVMLQGIIMMRIGFIKLQGEPDIDDV
jgi:hypothetical protein